jgi:hypothetical protein
MLLVSVVVVPASAYYYCCAEWVNDYSSNPDFTVNLVNNDENAEGFYCQLSSKSPWYGDFIKGDSQALERHWKDSSKPGNGIDYIYTDDTNFAFFSGHGYDDGSGFAFGTTQDDFKLHYNDALWGNTKMDWITLDACRVLREDRRTNWHNAFGGLHSMTGFHTACTDVTNRGSNFARRMDGTWTTQPITTAWFMAAKDTEPSDRYAAALARDGCWGDYIYGHGSQGTPGTSFLYSKYQC